MRTAECVTPMHPDKMCDRISDAILDECLRQDPDSRVAIEVMGGHGKVQIMGELTTEAKIPLTKINEIVERITNRDLSVEVNIRKQSSEIARGVDTGGAGDQGVMRGYACDDNVDMIPQALYLARSLCRFLYDKYPYDGKTQITLNDNNEVSAIVASFQNTDHEILEASVQEWYSSFLDLPRCEEFSIFANAAGDWVQGGFDGDTGVTGRKLAIDNYGTDIPIGGGAFSGKDATKVDRSGAYMAHKIARDYKRKFKAKEVFVKLAYAIGVAEPVMATVEIDGLSQKITGYDLTPQGIIKFLDLKKPQFEQTACWGHFGNNFTWDKGEVGAPGETVTP